MRAALQACMQLWSSAGWLVESRDLPGKYLAAVQMSLMFQMITTVADQ